jgi:putative MATE family efflux protein
VRPVKDLTTGSIGKHILKMSAPIAAGMLFQTLYFMIDLYFVAHLGAAAVAGVGAGGNFMFIVFALAQVLGVGTVALISHAVGRKDQADANRVFNQSLALSAICGVLTLAIGYAVTGSYMRTLGADEATMRAGTVYMWWFLPSLGLQFAVVAMASALRGTGIVQPGMIVQMITVILNIVLAPVLIAGWGTGHPMGVAGAGLASSLALAAGVVLLAVYFYRLEHYVAFGSSALRPDLAVWGRLLRIGLPAGGEFALMFLYMEIIYWIIRRFGPDAQAGFGIGMRINQSLFMPAMAVAFAAAPIVGQNFAAGKFGRVREAALRSALIGMLIMALCTVFCQWRAEWAVRAFTTQPGAIAVGTQFLKLISLNFVAAGLVFTCSSVFQGLGNTVPAVASSATRILSFVGPAFWLAAQPGFRLEQLWYVSVASMAVQAVVSLALLRREFRRRLDPATAKGAA